MRNTLYPMLFFYIQLSHHKLLYHFPKGSWKQARIIPSLVHISIPIYQLSVFNYLPSDSSVTHPVSAILDFTQDTEKFWTSTAHTNIWWTAIIHIYWARHHWKRQKREYLFHITKIFWLSVISEVLYLKRCRGNSAEETTATFSRWQVIVSLCGLDSHDCTGVQFKMKRLCSRYLHHLRI